MKVDKDYKIQWNEDDFKRLFSQHTYEDFIREYDRLANEIRNELDARIILNYLTDTVTKSKIKPYNPYEQYRRYKK